MMSGRIIERERAGKIVQIVTLRKILFTCCLRQRNYFEKLHRNGELRQSEMVSDHL
jgi:hypothetical protein